MVRLGLMLLRAGLLLTFAFCAPVPQNCSADAASPSQSIESVRTNKAEYKPGEPVMITVQIANGTDGELNGWKLELQCMHLEKPVATLGPVPVTLGAGETKSVTLRWLPPADDFQGYAVCARLIQPGGVMREERSSAVDVSSTWTKYPRYGYISECLPQSRIDSDTELRELKDFHINGLQFYDCLYKHEQPLAGTVSQPAPSWYNTSNKLTSRQTMLDLINGGHHYGIAAMQYDLLYGAWAGYEQNGVDPIWGMWKDPAHQKQESLPMPAGWATPQIYLFDAGNSAWLNYLIARMRDLFAAYPLDGWQVDQVGDLEPEFTYAGARIDAGAEFRPFLNKAKAELGKTIIFNNVGGYALDDCAANSTEDAVYVECWPWTGQKTYADLKRMIDHVRDLSHGKGVILAAYMDSTYSDQFAGKQPGVFNPPGVLLTDAAIFASGGCHIELGDGSHMLDRVYFANWNLSLQPSLAEQVRRYYDFLVAYENVLRGDLVSNNNSLVLSGVPSGPSGDPGQVWTFAKSGIGCQAIQLINFVGEQNADWADDHANYPAPTPLANIVAKYYCGAIPVRRLYWASPDADSCRLRPLSFTAGSDTGGAYIQFTLPSLDYWDMVYITTG
jgi:dextranase